MLKEFTTTQSAAVFIDVGTIILIESPVQTHKTPTSTLTLISGRTLDVFGTASEISEAVNEHFTELRASHTGVDWDGLVNAMVHSGAFTPGTSDAPAESDDPREKDLGETHG